LEDDGEIIFAKKIISVILDLVSVYKLPKAVIPARKHVRNPSGFHAYTVR